MYLHLGQSVVVPYTDIIGIFDLDNTTGSHITRDFLNKGEKNSEVVNVSDDLPKSFVVCATKAKKSIYLSQLSTATLRGRAEHNSLMSDM